MKGKATIFVNFTYQKKKERMRIGWSAQSVQNEMELSIHDGIRTLSKFTDSFIAKFDILLENSVVGMENNITSKIIWSTYIGAVGCIYYIVAIILDK